jgi:hypothetical protein
MELDAGLKQQGNRAGSTPFYKTASIRSGFLFIYVYLSRGSKD